MSRRHQLKQISAQAKSAAQSSAGSQPSPPMSAMLIPMNAAADVIASER
jgi:hypothetical protein